ncbi:uncharacterized protein LOC122927324 [Bufo gargarizans]|uniref:uncharacterized protein LOC122927324 n=1 Tax=Bufo gargarizans TaxID=30331 RepID=UPI001CF542AF|nr:uncharacterized protein LOC122927324 [Bufo gargarizans]
MVGKVRTKSAKKMSSDKARPPRKHRRIVSSEEEVSPSTDPGWQDDKIPVATRGDPPGSSRGRRGARGDRRRGSKVSTSEDEEVVVPHIDNDLLIQLVEARPALWDHGDPQHADHQHTQRLWEEVCATLFLTWEDLSRATRRQSIKKVQIRWQSMRDRFKKDCIKARPQYRYHAALGFLHQTLALRSASSTQESEAVPEPTATSSPSDHDTADPLPGPSGDRPREQIISPSWTIPSRQRTGRRRQGVYEDFMSTVADALQGFTEDLRSMRAYTMRCLERAESSRELSPSHHYLHYLVAMMDQMNPEQLHEFKLLVENGSWEIMHRPPPQSLSQHPSLSDLPEQPPSFSSTPSPHFIPPASFPTPTHARESSSPSNSSSHHNPQFPPASFPRARDVLSGGLTDDGGDNIAGPRASTPPRQFNHL